MTPSIKHYVAGVCAAAVLALAACGGGDDPVPTALVGPAGGAVSAAAGASATIPAGALAQPINVTIEASAAGAPALPAGMVAVGPTIALTPHGTVFAQPVALRIPFDPTQVPAGSAVQLLQTNAAQDGWNVVAGATVSGSMVSASVSSFSWFVPVATAAPAAPVTPTGGISGNWTSLYSCDASDGTGFSGEEKLAITQTGNAVSFTASDGASGSGTVDGAVVTWSSTGPGYTESGTWEIRPTALIKRSTYVNTNGSGGGTCSGSIHKD